MQAQDAIAHRKGTHHESRSIPHLLEAGRNDPPGLPGISSWIPRRARLGSLLCRYLQGDEIPVTVRYSNSRSGNPWGPATTAAMAARFYLPDGTTTDLVSLTAPLFFARTPEETLEFLKAVRPDPATGKPDPNRVGPFLAGRPWI